MINVVLIGTAEDTRARLAACDALRLVRVAAVVLTGGDPELLHDCQCDVEGLSDLETCLSRCAPALVDVRLGPAARNALIGRLLRCRCSLLLKGPLADTLENADRLVRAARRRRIALGTTGTLRFRPAVARLKELVAAGALGQLTGMRLEGADIPEARAAPSQRLIAEVDLCNWVFGQAVQTVPLADCPDAGTAGFRIVYAGGVSATVTARSAHCESGIPAARRIAVEGNAGHGCCEVWTAATCLACDAAMERVRVGLPGQDARDVSVPPAQPALAELGYYANAVPSRDGWSYNSAPDSFAAMAVATAALQTVRSGAAACVSQPGAR